MAKYIAIGIWMGSIRNIGGKTAEEAAIAYTENFEYDPLWVFTEKELRMAKKRKETVYKKFRSR